MLNRMLKLSKSQAGVVHGKATIWGVVTRQRQLLKENLCLLLLCGKVDTEPLRVCM